MSKQVHNNILSLSTQITFKVTVFMTILHVSYEISGCLMNAGDVAVETADIFMNSRERLFRFHGMHEDLKM